MNTYELRLEQGAQHKKLVLDAPDEHAAREQAIAKELQLVEFTLLPPTRDLWEQPPGSSSDDPDGLVNLRRWDAHDPVWAAHAASLSYGDAVSVARERLRNHLSRVDIDARGKVQATSLGKRSVGRLLAHQQVEPYTVAECREITQQQQTAYASVDGMRELVQIAKRLRAENDPRWSPTGWERIFEQFAEWGVPLNIVTAAIHGVGVLAQDTGGTPIVWGTGTGGDTIFAALLTAYTADPDTHAFWSSVSATQITGTGYTANGVALAGKAVSYDTTTDQTRLDANDAAWTTSTLSATDAAVVDRTPATDAARQVVGSVDFGATVTTTAGTFTVAWDATGIVVRDYT